MAKSKYNVVTHGLSGKVGDLLVFSQRFGQTIVGKIPVRTESFTEDQMRIRERFSKAVNWARTSLKNASLKALYEMRAGGGLTAFHFAFADYFKAPTISDVATGGYTGTPGSILEVIAVDDTKVMSVSVDIIAPSGTLIESGAAVEDPESGKWVYTSTATNPTLAGSKLKVYAQDIPENTTVREIQL